MTSTYIEKLYLGNFRQFQKLEVEFHRNFNFIAGPNGCGKTSILAGISHCLSHTTYTYSRFQKDAEFWTDLTLRGHKKRIGLGKGSFKEGAYREQSIQIYNTPPQDKDRQSIPSHQATAQLKGLCPLFIGAERSIKYKKINGMTREETSETQTANYISQATRQLYGESSRDVKQWFINRYFMIDKDWAVEEKENWTQLISALPRLAPFDSNFSYIRTGREFEPVFSLYGEECYMEELSAGFQAVLLIIANIIEWIEGTRSPGERVVSQASGTVLIDELDVHLHPEWQFTLRDGLVGLFPNIQFIVTTHSPHLLSSAKEGEVIIMRRRPGENELSLKPTEKRFSGWSTDQILSEVMGVASLENKDYEKIITDAFDKISEGSIDGLENSIELLSKVAHPSDSILTILRIKHASMVALSDD